MTALLRKSNRFVHPHSKAVLNRLRRKQQINLDKPHRTHYTNPVKYFTQNLLGDGYMDYQVNYKYVHENGKLRSGAIVLAAKDIAEAKKEAVTRLKAEHDTRFQVTSVIQFGTK